MSPWWTESLDDFKKELKIKKEMLYTGKSSELTSKQVDKFYFCDFSAKKEDIQMDENEAIMKCLKVLREKSQKVKEQRASNLFKKKKAPELVEKPQKKNANEQKLNPEPTVKKGKPKDILTLKNFLKNKGRLNNLKGDYKTQKKINRTEIPRSSILQKKNQDNLQESLRKYLPKGFKKMKKKKSKAQNSTKNQDVTLQKHSSSILSKESKIDNFFKTSKNKKGPKKLFAYPKSQKQVKLDSLIHGGRRTGATTGDDSGLGVYTKKEKSLPKIALMMNSHKNISQHLSKRYLEKTQTEYDYMGSDRNAEVSKFDYSRLSHGSMISNNLKKKVCIKKRDKKPIVSLKKQPKKSQKLGVAKAITAKKRKLETKQYFRSENPHLKTAPDIIRKSKKASKKGTMLKPRKEISIPKNLMKHMKANHFSNKMKSIGVMSKLPKSFRKAPKLHDQTIEGGNFGIFDFSVKPSSKGIVSANDKKSYDNLTRLFSQKPKKANAMSSKRLGYSSTSVKKQRLTTDHLLEKKYNRCATYNSQKMKINKVKLSALAKNNPFKGKKKAFKGLTGKYSGNKMKNFKNLTINTFSPKNGFFKQKVIKNLTDKNVNKNNKGFFNDSTNNYFQMSNGFSSNENQKVVAGKLKLLSKKGSQAKSKKKLPQQQVYNNIRMGDSNVKNKFIINIGILPKPASAQNKPDLLEKKYFEGFQKIEKEIQQIFKLK